MFAISFGDASVCVFGAATHATWNVAPGQSPWKPAASPITFVNVAPPGGSPARPSANRARSSPSDGVANAPAL